MREGSCFDQRGTMNSELETGNLQPVTRMLINFPCK